jgi:polar amino acid transport system permease protein
MGRITEHFLSPVALETSWVLLRLGSLETLRLVMATFVLALLAGLALAWARSHRWRPLRLAAAAYVDLARITPPLVWLVLVYYALPAAGLPSLDTFQAAAFTFTLIHAAGVAEIFRGGLRAVGRNQRDAAQALGLSPGQALRLVVVPQAIPVILPPLTSQFTQIVRDSPLAFIIGYADLLVRAREAQALTVSATPLVAAGALYLLFLLALQGVSAWLERRCQGSGRAVRREGFGL